MAHLRGTSRAAGPIVARVVGTIRVSAAVPLGSRENLVLNRWRITHAVDDLSMLIACGLLEQIAAALRLNQSIAVKLAEVRRDNGVLRFPQLRERPVEPRPGADTVSRVDGRLSGTSLGAEIGVPGVAARADSRRERLAMRIGTRKSAEVSPFTETEAGDEKSHSSLRRCRAAGGRRDALSIRRVLLSQHQARGQHQSTQHDNISMWFGHGFDAILVNCKTVKQALAVGFRQIRLGTAARSVSGVPGTAATAIAVGKTDLGIGSAIGSI
jgi:hypothetical protein